jgi:hypothetical protein
MGEWRNSSTILDLGSIRSEKYRFQEALLKINVYDNEDS